MDQTKRHHRHDGCCNTYPQENSGDGLFQPQIKYGRYQGACPRSCAGQGDCHKDAEADGTVLVHHPPLQVGFFLQMGNLLIPPFAALAQPGKDMPDVYDDKGNRDHVADNRRRQGQRIIQSQSNAIG